jgi:dTMP kinase
VIEPALTAGTWVICDRFTDTSRAYQGAGRQFPLEDIDRIADWVHSDVQPDLTVLLDAPVDLARQRAGLRGQPDRIETERSDFFERARACFLDLAEQEPERFAVIDASHDLATVQAASKLAVDQLLDKVMS